MPIFTVDNPLHDRLLHRPAKKVKDFQSPEILILKQEMTKIASAKGAAGVAATQLGYSYRIFALNIDKTQPPMFFFNPKVLELSEETYEVEEGCLSVPGKVGKLERHRTIKISWQDELGRKNAPNGHKYEWLFEGFEAQAVQHEMDHLDGKLYSDVAETLMSNDHLQRIFEEAMANEQARILKESEAELETETEES